MWKTLKNNGDLFMLKVKENDDNLEIFITDLKQIWSKMIDKTAILPQFQLEGVISSLLETIAQLTDENNEMVEIVINGDNIDLNLSSKISEFTMKFTFTLVKGSGDSFFKEVTVPLIKTLTFLEQQRDMLSKLVQKKDREIEQYKMEKGEISRGDLVTERFDPTILNLNDDSYMVNIFANSEKFWPSCTNQDGNVEVPIEYVKVDPCNPRKRERRVYSSKISQKNETVDSEMDAEIPKNTLERADEADETLLPRKSRLHYDKVYQNFEKWMQKNDLKISKVNEEVLMSYFQELSESLSPTSLCAKHSMLKSTLLVYKKIDIKNYSKLETFLKQHSKEYIPKKSNILTRDDVIKFMTQAPDDKFLLEKVVVVMVIFGGLRRVDLVKLKVDDVYDRGSVMVVKIRNAKPGCPRSFTITEEEINAISIVRKYTSLRPKGTKERRFFLGYRNGRCVSQVVGKNTLGGVPAKIAKYLGYVNAEGFTGQCLRKISATFLVHSDDEDIFTLKRHGQWENDTVASEYIEESMESKSKISRLIGTSNDEAGTSGASSSST